MTFLFVVWQLTPSLTSENALRFFVEQNWKACLISAYYELISTNGTILPSTQYVQVTSARVAIVYFLNNTFTHNFENETSLAYTMLFIEAYQIDIMRTMTNIRIYNKLGTFEACANGVANLSVEFVHMDVIVLPRLMQVTLILYASGDGTCIKLKVFSFFIFFTTTIDM